MHVPEWEDALWSELKAQPASDQIITAGEWITYITHTLLPALGAHRRERVLYLLEDQEWSYGFLADTVGARPATMKRLAEEGRATRRKLSVPTP